ncbi:methyltransferase [Nitrosomonas oligotropha]|uniref:Methylase of polypeptide chain release factors n=1 Tax=Nitrosomonas oligotropha TaxID=42354 RepID=A0A1H8JCX3_9PROT|nr:class I SAM-dependent methyltransferase [Nitrosomonas oligotropha]SDW05087.1 Methylase of polypeptide chain release factors [Nitrosomonas oligotropha]SEN78610.1 Methylase of polypeptide chain release factors [Nitrosomonas oligotropha]
MCDYPVIRWHEADEEKSARWCSEKDLPPPKRVQVIDDRMPADTAYRLACEGTALLWRGDFQNARQLLQALARRVDKKKPEKPKQQAIVSPAEAFHRHRLVQSQRARTLEKLLIPFNADHSIPLRRAPDVHAACLEAYGACTGAYIASLRELLGLIGAYEWRKKGIEIAALGMTIHPHYGVFAPIRNEYVKLVTQAPLPKLLATQSIAFDIGTGTGVLAAALALRGVQHITATDQDPRALQCARDNLTRLNLIDHVELVQTDLFPQGQAALIVCNPPWIPARPSSPLEHAIFDPESRMLRGFLQGLRDHLLPDGEGWLILSDFAEHLGLRTREELLHMIDAAGLKVLGRTDIKPHHPRVSDTSDPLHSARAAELTSLWRLAIK